MRHDLAQYRWRRWGFVWIAGNAPDEVTAEVVTEQAPGVHVHYHLHLPPGTDLSGLNLALPPGSAVTATEEE